MKQVVLNIEESKYNFFLELIESLEFVKLEKTTSNSNEEIKENLKQAFQDLKKYKEGKLVTSSAKDFLDEL